MPDAMPAAVPFALRCAAALLALACAGTGSALAQQGVQDRKAVMDAQIDLLRKEKELNDARQANADPAAAGLPQVIAVMGLDGSMMARLQLSNGVVNTYRVGETVRAGMTVASITPRQVSVAVGRGKSVRAVPLEFIAGTSQPGASAGAFAGLPPGMRAPVPPELLPDPPAVRLPSGGMPALAPAAAQKAPGASPASP